MKNPIDTSGSNRSTAPGRRLWYAFGAGGLFLVILGGLAAWLPWHRQVQAITEIERLGGYVSPDLSVPDWLPGIVGDELIGGGYVVNLRDTQVTDAGLVHLKELTAKLQFLNLSDTGVTDAGLVHLKGLTSLQSLHLGGTEVTDVGLEHLKGLTSLKTLDLRKTKVTTAGVEDLQSALPKCYIAK